MNRGIPRHPECSHCNPELLVPVNQLFSARVTIFQAAWRTGALVLGGVLEKEFGADVCRVGASELGLYCDHLLDQK